VTTAGERLALTAKRIRPMRCLPSSTEVMNADCAELQHTFWPLVAPKNKSLARSNKTRMRVPC